MKIGIIGVGTIAAAFVKGVIRTHGDQVQVYLSPRNRENAQSLAEAYHNVQIMESNQAVLDQCDWAVLCVIPQIAPEVLGGLTFRRTHKVVSFITAFSLDRLKAIIGETAVLTRMVPLPFIEFCTGPLAVYPITPELKAVFSPLGDLIPASDETALGTMITITALMSPFYAMLGQVVTWGMDHQLPAEFVSSYTILFFEALLLKAANLKTKEIPEIWREMTPGGLNEMAVTAMDEQGAFAAWTHALNLVYKRISQGLEDV